MVASLTRRLAKSKDGDGKRGYVLAPRKAIFYPLPVTLHEEAATESWILWRFDSGE